MINNDIDGQQQYYPKRVEIKNKKSKAYNSLSNDSGGENDDENDFELEAFDADDDQNIGS